jgi:uncharacterized damage-inducible protein DinB
MKTNILEKEQVTPISADALLSHWQGHRRLTRRVIEAFPEDKLFVYSVGGMRPFAALAVEMIQMASPGIVGLATGEWKKFEDAISFKTKKELLAAWDETTEKINTFWTQIAPQRFTEVDVAFGQYENVNHDTLFYFIDNEIHHRGQGYVYLRSLGIEPPAFWDRG